MIILFWFFLNGIISDELYGHILVVNIKGTCYSVFIVEFKRCSYLHGMKMKKNPEKTIPACYEHFERCFSDPLSEVFIIANLGHAVRRIPACTDWREPESRLLVSKRGYQLLFKHHVINRLNHFINDWKKKKSRYAICWYKRITVCNAAMSFWGNFSI